MSTTLILIFLFCKPLKLIFGFLLMFYFALKNGVAITTNGQSGVFFVLFFCFFFFFFFSLNKLWTEWFFYCSSSIFLVLKNYIYIYIYISSHQNFKVMKTFKDHINIWFYLSTSNCSNNPRLLLLQIVYSYFATNYLQTVLYRLRMIHGLLLKSLVLLLAMTRVFDKLSFVIIIIDLSAIGLNHESFFFLCF